MPRTLEYQEENGNEKASKEQTNPNSVVGNTYVGNIIAMFFVFGLIFFMRETWSIK